ncbi:MAG TPA: hypothetical protein PKA88_20545 [Polyangiaceae bacterium]|mgnify:CR=1 FL=1|nr:hypothetical protein [Polyangiaceae bacterium]
MNRAFAFGRGVFVVVACLLCAPASRAQQAPAAAPPAQAPAAESGAAEAGSTDTKEAKKAPSVTGGYSWSDKKPRTRRWVRRRKIDPNAAIATYPGFLMFPDGTSQVWVYVNKKVPVVVSAAAGRVTYILTGADIAVYNNMHPLVTEYFDTPMRSARLRRDKNGAQLVLDLREATGTPSHKIEDGPGGTMVLRIQLPKAQKRYSDAPFRPLPRRALRK